MPLIRQFLPLAMRDLVQPSRSIYVNDHLSSKPACMELKNISPYRVLVAAGGFSIIELMTVTAMVGILLALAIPSFREFSIRTQVTQLGNDLVTDLNIARAEAVKQGLGVALVPTTAGNWSGGWSVVANTLPAATTMRTHAALPTGYTMKAAAVGGVSVTPLAYSSTGALGTPSVQVDFAICRPDANAALSQLVVVKSVGVISSQRNVTDATANMAIGCPGP